METLRAIKIAERRHYERCFAFLTVSIALYIAANRYDNVLEHQGERGRWIDDRAMRAVNRWRGHFAPERVGLPLEFESED